MNQVTAKSIYENGKNTGLSQQVDRVLNTIEEYTGNKVVLADEPLEKISFSKDILADTNPDYAEQNEYLLMDFIHHSKRIMLTVNLDPDENYNISFHGLNKDDLLNGENNRSYYWSYKNPEREKNLNGHDTLDFTLRSTITDEVMVFTPESFDYRLRYTFLAARAETTGTKKDQKELDELLARPPKPYVRFAIQKPV